MGVSYFSCDECGLVMNDHGGPKSMHVEYRHNGVITDGTYCEDCADSITSGKIPILSHLSVVFCLKKQGSEDRFIEFPELCKSSLKQLIEDLKTCDNASVLQPEWIEDEIVRKKAYIELFEKDSKEDNFQCPEDAYNYFIKEFIPELDDVDKFSWISPPLWPNVTKKRMRLKNTICTLNGKIDDLQTKLLHKQRKLNLLPPF